MLITIGTILWLIVIGFSIYLYNQSGLFFVDMILGLLLGLGSTVLYIIFLVIVLISKK